MTRAEPSRAPPPRPHTTRCRCRAGVPTDDAAWLDHVGLEQPLRDWYAVLKAGIPSQRIRARKVFCGGHSMGGPLTAAFPSWDFDGNPQTTSDAGYRQCAGFVGPGTTLSGGVPG